MTDTIDVAGTYVVGANKALGFVNQDGFHLLDGETPPRLVIAGSVSVTNSAISGETFGAITFDGQDGAAATVVIREGGVFDVDTQNQSVGIALFTANSRLINQGRLAVSSAANFAAGMWGSADVTNTGQILVEARGEARGVDLIAAATITNSGLIRVTGGDEAEAIRTHLATEIYNDGKIIASANGEASSYGISVGSGSSGEGLIHVVNSGLIRADFAIEVFSTAGNTVNLENSGVIQGQLELQIGDDHIINTGHIAQSVNLEGGNDTYDGSAGVTDGVLHGGAGDDLLITGRGEDILVGGEGADTLTGGGGSDYFVFETLEDSHGALVDLITDLKNRDIIDVSSIDADTGKDGDQAFHLVATLDGHARELALSYDPETGLTSLVADVDGDGHADLSVLIAGDHEDFTHFVR